MSETLLITKSGEYDLSSKNIDKLIVKASNVLIKNLKMFKLENKCIQLLGDYITLSNCSFSECITGEVFIQVKGQYTKITNCLFERFNEKGVIICVSVYKNKMSHCLISSCNFRDCSKEFNNGAEVIRIGDSKSSLYDSKCIIYNNFFNNCDREIELISVKSCNNIISHNKIIDCKSGIVLRHGRRNKVLNNYIHGNYREGCCGIRIIGKEHQVKYNTIEGIVNKSNPFRTAISIMTGELDNKLNGYEPVRQCEISYNDILGCEVAFSLGVDNKRKSKVLPNKLTIEGNRIVKCNYFINDDKKCLGLENSYIENNHIIDKDIKIDTKKADDLDSDIVIVEFFKELGKNNLVLKENDAEEEKKEEKEDNDFDFSNIIDEIQRLKNEENDDRCEKCINDREKLSIVHKEYKEIIDKLNHQLSHYKGQLQLIKNNLFNS